MARHTTVSVEEVAGVPPAAGADGASNALGGVLIDARLAGFNGTTWDRQRNNEEIMLLSGAARTAQTDSSDQTNYNARGLLLFINVSADPAAASITPTLRVIDSVSGQRTAFWTAAAPIAAVGNYTYYFSEAAAGGIFTEIISFGIPARSWHFRMAVADADSMTYSVAAVLLI